MKKIAEIIRFYSLDEIMKFIEDGGEYPRHHVWCYDQLNANGLPTEQIEFDKNSFLNKVGNKILISNLQQQINLLKRSKEFDVVYSPFIGDVFLLALLRKIGLFKKPIVGLAFETYIPFKNNFLKKLRQQLLRNIYINGIDSLLFYTNYLYDKNVENGDTNGKQHLSNSFGADLDFFNNFIERQTEPPSLDYIYSTGGSGRDYKTLISAFKQIDFTLKITTKRDLDEHLVKTITPNVIIDNSIVPGLYSVGLIRKEYYNSLAVAIPTTNYNHHSPVGNTVIMEAFAMGKPVLATRNRSYPFNLEKEKVGFEIDHGDVQGWKDCVNYIIAHPEEAIEMGERARYLCAKKYNYKSFSQEIISLINKTRSTKTNVSFSETKSAI